MFDTNICSYVLRRHPASVLERFYAAKLDELSVLAIVAAELRYGASRLGSEKFAALLEQWLDLLPIEPWPEDASKVYARIRHELERQATPIGNMDLLIAAHALAIDAVLVTNNGREFDRVPGLKLENWA